MSTPISIILYDWLVKKRITTLVAQEMRISEMTLSAELRPDNPAAKLGADTLVPLFQALRNLGYEKEMRGLISTFSRDLEGQGSGEVSREGVVSQMLMLSECLGHLCAVGTNADKMKKVTELRKMNAMIRMEILPTLMKMMDMNEAQIRKLNKRKSGLFSLRPQKA